MATPVVYQVSDEADVELRQTVHTTITPTVAPPGVSAVDDVSSGDWDTNQTIRPLANDPHDDNFDLDNASLKLCGIDPLEIPVDCSLTTLVVPGEGTYTVNADGTVTFDPLPTFTGDATPIRYQVSDSLDRVVDAMIRVTVGEPPLPVAVNDTSTGVWDANQTISPLTNDPHNTNFPLQPATLKLCQVDDPATTQVNEAEVPDNCTATSVTIPGEGTYTVNPDGTVTFDPLPSFVGTVATPVTYQVEDSLERVVNATITPTVGPPPAPEAEPVTSSGPQDVNQVFDPTVNDTAGSTQFPLDQTTVKFCGVDDPATTTVDESQPPHCTATTLIVPGEGTYTVHPVTGVVTFDPEPDFVGTATPITYQISDTYGNTASSTITPTVVGRPNAVDDATSGPFNQPQSDSVLSDDSAATGATLVPSSLTLMDGSTPVTSVTALAGDGTVQGVYTLGPDNTIVFTPEPGFVGTATPVTYRVTDSLGQTATATYTPTINPPPPPVADPDETSGPFNTAQTMDVVVNDASFTGVPISDLTIKLFDGTSYVTTPVTTADGVYSIVDGKVQFLPNTGFVGEAAPITYQIADSVGQTATTTYTPTVIGPPVAVNDATSGPFNQSQSEDVLGNDGAANGATLVPGTLRLVVPGEFGVFTLGETVTVEDGVYRIDENGHIEFTPNDGFVGTADPVTYQVTDSLGQTVTATYTPTIDPAALPVMVPDTSSGPYQGTQTKDVLDNDTLPAGVTWRPETLTLVGAAPDGSVTVTGDKTAPDGTVTTGTQGVYTVVDGKIVFTPEPDFVGTATPVTYQATDSLGRTGSTTYTPTVDPIPVPAAVPDRTIGPLDQPQSQFVLLNDDPGPGAQLDGTHLRLWDPVLEEWTDTVTALAPDGTVQGTYTIRVVGNPRIEIVFTPVTGFVGVATPVTYEMANNFGQVATTTYTPEIRTDPPPSPVVRAAEVVVATLVRTGLGSLTGALALVGGLMGLGAAALVAARRSRTLANKD